MHVQIRQNQISMACTQPLHSNTYAAVPVKLELRRTVSAQMQRFIGDKWYEWGSEQVMSNLIVSNQPDAQILPHPDYADCHRMRPNATRFVHFMGTCRFRGGRYADMINELDWKM